MRISMNDFRDNKGRVDFQKYEQAQKEVGERCYKCGAYTLFGNIFNSDPKLCTECKYLENTSELDYSKYIRCPKCRHLHEADGHEIDIFQEEVSFCCHECNYDFDVQIHLSWKFESPELLEEK